MGTFTHLQLISLLRFSSGCPAASSAPHLDSPETSHSDPAQPKASSFPQTCDFSAPPPPSPETWNNPRQLTPSTACQPPCPNNSTSPNPALLLHLHHPCPFPFLPIFTQCLIRHAHPIPQPHIKPPCTRLSSRSHSNWPLAVSSATVFCPIPGFPHLPC